MSLLEKQTQNHEKSQAEENKLINIPDLSQKPNSVHKVSVMDKIEWTGPFEAAECNLY